MATSCYTSPYRPAREAAAALDGSPNLRRMFATWRLTVCSLRTRRSAIWWFVRPSATRPSTSSSRLLRPPRGVSTASAGGVARVVLSYPSIANARARSPSAPISWKSASAASISRRARSLRPRALSVAARSSRTRAVSNRASLDASKSIASSNERRAASCRRGPPPACLPRNTPQQVADASASAPRSRGARPTGRWRARTSPRRASALICHLQPGASLDPGRVGKSPEVAIGQLRPPLKVIAIEGELPRARAA